MKILGILGGLGPESTGNFYLELIKKFQSEFRPSLNQEYPHIMINSIPAIDLISVNDETDILISYKRGLKELESWGADIIIIACNSAYNYFDELQAEVNVPIINARREVAKYLDKHQIRGVQVLASPTSIRSGLYRFTSVESLEISNHEVEALGHIIENYNLGRICAMDLDFVHDLALRAIQRRCLIISGCTEISSILSKTEIDYLDPMGLMIDAMISIWKVERDFEIKSSTIHGSGIFAQLEIPSQSIFYQTLENRISDVPVAKWAHLDGKWFADDQVLNWINHSCDPNSELILVDGRPTLRSLHNIKTGEEITCDYSQTEVGGTQVNCSCGSGNCRKTFSRID